MLELHTRVGFLPKVGPKLAKKLEKLGIITIKDLLFHFPSRYDDLSKVVNISELSDTQTRTVQAQVWEIKNIRTRYGKFLTMAKIGDSSGVIDIVWFNQPYISKNLRDKGIVNFSGKLGKFNNKDFLISPEYEFSTGSDGTNLHTGRIVPIYPETQGITSKWLRSKIFPLLGPDLQIKDYLPPTIVMEEKFYDLSTALRQIHFPDSFETLSKAIARLGFEEIFVLELRSRIYKQKWQDKARTTPLTMVLSKLEEFVNTLPFKLTNAQRRVVREISDDLAKDTSMNRLLEGDVGSGKTVVAGIASLIAIKSGKRVIFMAPTEVLAIQHYNTLNRLFSDHQLSIGLSTGSKKILLKDKPDITVGTHALLHTKDTFDDVGLLVIDEQHRFGVEQRALLREKTKTPHILTMTATPIPRTLALTLYGDLDISVIDELPSNRTPIKTYIVPETKRSDAYGFIRSKALLGQQSFIICPLIEFSESLASVKNATQEFEKLKNEIFPDLNLSLLHGRMSGKEKEKVLTEFKDKEHLILVATPVVEVGIDITNASIMVIETAERFGLAALHQLRGRVGRGDQQSYCLLFTDSTNPKVISRLKLMTKYTSGIKLAEMDLQLRGAGEIFGTAQSGLSELKVADLTDLQLIEKTRAWLSKMKERKESTQELNDLIANLEREEKLISPD